LVVAVAHNVERQSRPVD